MANIFTVQVHSSQSLENKSMKSRKYELQMLPSSQSPSMLSPYSDMPKHRQKIVMFFKVINLEMDLLNPVRSMIPVIFSSLYFIL